MTAASDWDGAAERKHVRPRAARQLRGAVPRRPGAPAAVDLVDTERATLRTPRLERAIGVIYRPETERQSHYFHARLADQFDAVIHLDQTRALEPLERTADWEAGEAPDLYPWGV